MDKTKMLVEKAMNNPTYRNLQRARVALEGQKRKQEVKEEFEKYLRESLNGRVFEQ